MHIRNYLQVCLLFTTFIACRQGADNVQTMAANTGSISPSGEGKAAQQKKPATADIIFQSADGGQTWQDISEGLPVDLLVMRIVPGQNGEVYLGAERGVYRYSPPPAAATWTNELPMNDQVVGVFSGETGLYASWIKSGIFKNLPGRSTWMPMDSPTEDNQFVWSAVETPEGAVLVSNESGIYKTTDEGIKWTHVFRDASPTSLKIENGVLYGVCFNGILRSTDGGNHWDWALEDGGSYKSIHQLDGALVAFMYKEGTWKTRFLSTSNLDTNWQHLAKGLSGMKSINDFEQAGDTIYCSHDGGVSRSDDRGKTWKLLRPAPEDNMMLRLAISGGKVFVVKTAGC
jgi:photosystem II stability/assembly factor-like uncharacterized protein